MPDGYIPGWKLLGAVSTPKLESFVRCLTPSYLKNISPTLLVRSTDETALCARVDVTRNDVGRFLTHALGRFGRLAADMRCGQ